MEACLVLKHHVPKYVPHRCSLQLLIGVRWQGSVFKESLGNAELIRVTPTDCSWLGSVEPKLQSLVHLVLGSFKRRISQCTSILLTCLVIKPCFVQKHWIGLVFQGEFIKISSVKVISELLAIYSGKLLFCFYHIGPLPAAFDTISEFCFLTSSFSFFPF